jgi:hypothetical protein
VSGASWFETRGFAVLLTMRFQDRVLKPVFILKSGVFAASRRMRPPKTL